ncbi:MAG: hypothetical protein FJ395_11475 [Verrucomicrobia bacterium]|nr:hypothetical protein [Verrucomicrobiota bacterium]
MRLTDIIGNFPYRIALAGGWIDQPFVSKHNPAPPGSMVVISIEPAFPWMDRCGIASSTRRVALERWGRLPKGNPKQLVQELYEAENKGKTDPSGSQDMIGLIYPGVCRLDYDGGFFPCHIESNNDPKIARWIEKIIHVLPVAPRPDGYSPLGVKNPDPAWIQRLGQTGKDCFNAILARNVKRLGKSLNDCMACWETILPHTVRHPAIKTDLVAILKWHQSKYDGAMYSGCGGGYLFIASEDPVPGTFTVKVRIAK